MAILTKREWIKAKNAGFHVATEHDKTGKLIVDYDSLYGEKIMNNDELQEKAKLMSDEKYTATPPQRYGLHWLVKANTNFWSISKREAFTAVATLKDAKVSKTVKATLVKNLVKAYGKDTEKDKAAFEKAKS